MTIPELRAAAYNVRRMAHEPYDPNFVAPTWFYKEADELANFATAILARLSDAEVGEILGREVRGE